ncbi:MAG: tRNA pseudouridine(55) synthase TruB [Clostridia bacterium]|nr:tRNA pseudouridine(55) synthase TruB [Clostridia bacterium]
MKDGVIVINKGEGITSQGVVTRVKRLFSVKKAGHTGTLDPMATGVLPVMLGKASRASDFLMESKKHYIATMRLGIETDTEDITGTVLSECEKIPSEDEVLLAAGRMVGEIMQIPPMYSAIKVGGKKLMDLARDGKTVEREPRKITVYSLSAEKISDSEYRLDIECSKGTYIRTVCADIGRALGCGAAMSSLMRAESAGFCIENAYTLDELEKMSESDRWSLVIPTDRLFDKYEELTLDAFFARLARHGLEIYLKKIKKSYPVGTILRMCDSDGFFALGEVREYADGLAVKPIRWFGEV